MTKRALEGNLGYKGERGYSAYEIAVQEGYEGTEEEWINHFGLDLSGYVQTDDVVDDLTHEYTTRPLSAKQGKVLKNGLDTANNYISLLQSGKVDSSRIAVVSGSLEISQGETITSIDYPEGFNYNNCIIIGGRDGSQPIPCLVLTSNGLIDYHIHVITGNPKIWMYVYERTASSHSIDYKIVLFKIDNLMESEE